MKAIDQDDREPHVGNRVINTITAHFALRTRIVEIKQSEHGGTLYVMENGQHLTINEFRVEGKSR